MFLRSLAQVPIARVLARRARSAWGRARPLPRSKYTPATPRVGGRHELDFFFPPTPLTLGAAAMSDEASNFVLGVLEKLTPSEENETGRFFHGWARGIYGPYWRYADITTVLRAAAVFLRPSSYLEIGVRRGRSAAVVAATCPQCAIYGFDLWLEGYAGQENPGPDFVRSELGNIGHSGELVLVSGDSKQTVPAFLREHPDLYFDLITVDGDHSVYGAAADLANVLPRLKVGGIVVFDDICSAPLLMRVWRKLVKRDSRFASWEYTDAGCGVAAAIRLGDEPLLGTLF